MKPYSAEQAKFHEALVRALGYGDRRVKKVVLTCEAGQVDTAEVIEIITDSGRLEELSKVVKLVKADEQF